MNRFIYQHWLLLLLLRHVVVQVVAVVEMVVAQGGIVGWAAPLAAVQAALTETPAVTAALRG